jgi:hypothetical protein
MADVHKFRPVKNLLKLMDLDISTNEAAHPIIGDDNRWEYFELTKCLKTDSSKKY